MRIRGKQVNFKVMDQSEIITINPNIRFGKPCIRGMRISVEDILLMLSSGMTPTEILIDFPELTEEDIEAAKSFKKS